MAARLWIVAAFVLVLALPLVVRWSQGLPLFDLTAAKRGGAEPSARLVIVTPHVEQIRQEFAEGFDRWHRRAHGEPVEIDWRAPGGTSEIMKLLESNAKAAARQGRLRADGSFEPGAAGFDLFFGGGSFEHGKMKAVQRAEVIGGDGERRVVEYRLGVPAGFPQTQLDLWFGENVVGSQTLYDPEQYWLGAALSAFGIVYNRRILRDLDLPEPSSFRDLTDFRYFNLLGLADPRLSGSITTAYESILNSEKWEGWRTLRALCGNARFFASSATRPPIDVSQGEAAAGLAIDFYGRGQAQFVLRPGETPEQARVGYIDPPGAVYVDADPVSLLNGAGRADLARRFIEFVLSDDGQALWQFPARSNPRAAGNPLNRAGEQMGPRRYELRRAPVRRSMYAEHMEHFVDQVNPFEIASAVKPAGWRSAIAPMMAAFGIDSAEECRAAWGALNRARSHGNSGTHAVSPATHAEMERLFFAMPVHRFRPGTLLWPKSLLADLPKPAAELVSRWKVTTAADLDRALGKEGASLDPGVLGVLRDLAAAQRGAAPASAEFSPDSFSAIRADTDSWRDPVHGRRSLIAYVAFFRANYRRVVELSQGRATVAEGQPAGAP